LMKVAPLTDCRMEISRTKVASSAPCTTPARMNSALMISSLSPA